MILTFSEGTYPPVRTSDSEIENRIRNKSDPKENGKFREKLNNLNSVSVNKLLEFFLQQFHSGRETTSHLIYKRM